MLLRPSSTSTSVSSLSDQGWNTHGTNGVIGGAVGVVKGEERESGACARVEGRGQGALVHADHRWVLAKEREHEADKSGLTQTGVDKGELSPLRAGKGWSPLQCLSGRLSLVILPLALALPVTYPTTSINPSSDSFGTAYLTLPYPYPIPTLSLPLSYPLCLTLPRTQTPTQTPNPKLYLAGVLP